MSGGAHYGRSWALPEFQFPVDRGADQYRAYTEQVLIARRIQEYGMRFSGQRLLKHIEASSARIRLFTKIFLETTKLRRSDLGNSGAGQTLAVKKWFRDAGAPDVVFDKKTKEPMFNMDALLCWAADYKGRDFAEPAAALFGLRGNITNRRICRNYVKVLNRPDSDGRIHIGYNVVGTKGTRWSSSAEFAFQHANGDWQHFRLNAQNLPKKKLSYAFEQYGELPVKTSLRDCVLPDPGCQLIRFDFEGAEARLIAYNSGDKELMRLVETDSDIHTATVRAILPELGVPETLPKIKKGVEGAVTPAVLQAVGPLLTKMGKPVTAEALVALWLQCRDDLAKGMLYALAYQAPSKSGKDKYATTYSAAKKVFPHMTEEIFGQIVKRFFNYYTGLRAWQLELCDRVDRGEPGIHPLNGRTLYFAPVARGKNMQLNYYQQSGIGILIGRALPQVDALMDYAPAGNALLAQVHDELLVQCRKGEVDDMEARVAAIMSAPADFGTIVAGVPAAGDVGDDWATMTEMSKIRSERAKAKE